MKKPLLLVTALIIVVMMGCQPGGDKASQKFTKYVIDTTQTITGGMNGPLDIAVTPDESTLYVTNSASNQVTVFRKDKDGLFKEDAASALKEGLHTPTGIALDPKTGNLYVSSYDDNKILAFSPDADGKMQYNETLSVTESIAGPYDIDITPEDILLVTNFNTNMVQGFKKNDDGKFVPDAAVMIKNLNQPISVMGHHDGSIWVSNFGANEIVAYKKGEDGTYMLDTCATQNEGVKGPNLLLFGPDDNLYVADLNTSAIAVFNKNEKKGYELSIPHSVVCQVNSPSALAFLDKGKTMLVVNYGSNAITVYHKKEATVSKEQLAGIKQHLIPTIPHAKSTGTVDQTIPEYTPDPSKTIKGGIAGPQHMTFDQEGLLYVVNMTANNVTVFRKNNSGVYSQVPDLTITGGMNTPTGILIDQDGLMFVMSYLGNKVLAFARDGSGKYVPAPEKNLQKVYGPSTGCFDKEGNMYITMFNNNTVCVYTKNSEGLYRIDEAKTVSGNLVKPVALGIDDDGIMYVTNYGSKIVTAFKQDSTGHFVFDGDQTLMTEKVGSYAVRVKDNILYITDYNNARVDIWAKAKEGYRILAQKLTKDINQPTDLAFDANGAMYVFNYQDNSIVVNQVGK